MNRRLLAPDFLRGIGVLLMILDHTRYFLLDRNLNFFPNAGTNFGVFALLINSQIVTTIFLFLAGASVGLALPKFETLGLARKFFLIRGLAITLFELTVVHLLWRFNFFPLFVHLEAIFIIGVGILTLGLLLKVSRVFLALLTFVIIFGHNAFDSQNIGGPLWTIFKTGGEFNLGDLTISVSYPLLPWVPVVWSGFLASDLLKSPSGLRSLKTVGLLCLSGFLALRTWGGYGDPNSWIIGNTTLMTFSSLFGTYKYGGSLQHHLWTLGIILIALSVPLSKVPIIFKFLLDLGRRSLLAYVIHLFLIHLCAYLIFYRSGLSVDWLFTVSPRKIMPMGGGFSVSFVTVFFIIISCMTYWVTMLVSSGDNGTRKNLFRYL